VAILHRAELRPTKLELLNRWLPTRPWYTGPSTPDLSRVASYRFDDPDGEVGIETMLVRAGDGPILQAPLTYRAAPLDGGDAWLLGTSDHSVLGRRWIYDGCGDPVYATALATAILTGGTQAEEFVDVDGSLRRREPSMAVAGSGSASAARAVSVVRVDEGDPTVIVAEPVTLTLVRVLGSPAGDGLALVGTWDGQTTPLLLARAEDHHNW
jgi:hypothetical protein